MGKTTGILSFAVRIMFLGAMLFCVSAYAAPYSSAELHTYTQPDGSTFKVRLLGDEFFAYEETIDGYVIVFDESVKYYCYARLVNEKIVSSGIPVVTANSDTRNQLKQLKSVAIPKHIRLPENKIAETIQKRQTELKVDAKGRTIYPETGLAFKTARENVTPNALSTKIEGTIVGLTILVDFADDTATMTTRQVEDFCNAENYTQFNNAFSVRGYFLDQSNQKLDYQNIVTAYVRMPKPKSYYDDNSANTWNISKAQELASTAIDLLVTQGFDFRRLSTTTIGSREYIRAINIFYAGFVHSGWNRGLWPHSWSIPAKMVDESNKLYAYRYQLTNMGAELSIGTFCHESGHMVCDFPDLYAYNDSPVDLWHYSLMSSGNHGGAKKHPTNIDPYLKHKAGWIDYIDIDHYPFDCSFNYDKKEVYRIVNPNDNSQYYLLEFRHQYGSEGPTGGSVLKVNPTNGIVIYQVNEKGSNTHSTIVNTAASSYFIPYEIFVIEASTVEKGVAWYMNPLPFTDDGFNMYQGASVLSKNSLPDLSFWTNEGRSEGANFTVHSFSAYGPAMSCIVDSLFHTISTGPESELGDIYPKGAIRVGDGDSLTFNMKAKAGYSLVDLLVDGKSVGVTNSFAFHSITASHTIEPVFTRDITSTFNPDNQFRITVYPNPTDGILHIDLPDYSVSACELRVYDMTGKLQLNLSTTQLHEPIDLSQFASGSYILQLSADDKQYTQKIMVR